jgi:CRISPR-associated protein Csm3
MDELRWKENVVLSGKIKILTGLHIGGGNESVKIGGTDNPVAKTTMKIGDRLLEIPYIPGSSIKGKVRKLLDNYVTGLGKEEYKKAILDLFGPIPKDKDAKGVSRLIFRDCFPTNETLRIYGEENSIDLTEVKAENVIDQNMKATPRFIERIKPFTEFDFESVMAIYEGDDKSLYLKIIKEGFELLSHSYLGGSGTRGYGKVIIEYDEAIRDKAFYEKRSVEKKEEP